MQKTTKFDPSAPIPGRLALYIEAVCRKARIPFDPGSLTTRGQARAFVLDHRDVFIDSAFQVERASP